MGLHLADAEWANQYTMNFARGMRGRSIKEARPKSGMHRCFPEVWNRPSSIPPAARNGSGVTTCLSKGQRRLVPAPGLGRAPVGRGRAGFREGFRSWSGRPVDSGPESPVRCL